MKKNSKPRPSERTTIGRRLRVFLPVALIPNAVVVATVVLVALCALMLTDSGFVPLAATVAQLWLAVNLAPVASDSAMLSQLPMLPALGVVWLVGHRVGVAVRHRISILDLAVLTACVLVVPVLLALTAVAMLLDARAVLPVAVPPLAMVFGRVLLLHLGALAIGMGPKLWRALARRFSVPTMVVDPATPAVRFVLSLVVAGLLLVLVSLAMRWRVLSELLSTFDSGLATAGLLGVSLLYLPDAAVAGAAVLVGSEFHIGDASVSLYDATAVPLPPLPILAAFPESVGGWALVLVTVPLVLAGSVSYTYCRAAPRTWSEMVVAGLWAGTFTLIIGGLAGGSAGVYGNTGTMVIFTAVLVAVELAAVGAVVNAVIGLRQRRLEGATPVADDDVVGSPEADAPVAVSGKQPGGTDPGVDGEGVTTEIIDEEDLMAAEADDPGESTDHQGSRVADPMANTEGADGAAPADPAAPHTIPESSEHPDAAPGETSGIPGPGEPETGTIPDQETRPLP
ncbi:DUF6350 family protein [Corynebacterium sp. P5848]|uniref:cell division protein PerM n=1 Tax=Corynebacterium marambiense TaxID=2765364 RepID=UPI002260A6E1|nr:DUF6350 family protein [Corynebacterium marambiense]MCX7542264.1 DUF6350 family protein [Corynebacterium marambiense]